MGFFAKIGASITTVMSLLLPFLGKARIFRGFSIGLLWVLRVGLFVLIFVALAVVQHFILPDFVLPGTWGILNNFLWLPLLITLFYLLFLFGWWLYKLLIASEEHSYFPDIDEAWDEAVDALNRAGIDLTQAPLFLVLGRGGAVEEPVFGAMQVQYNVKQTPARIDAPLHVWANRDAIYVTCPGASLLGKHAANLSGGFDGAGGGADLGAADGTDEDAYRTVRPQGNLLEIKGILARASAEGRQVTEEERQAINELDARDRAEQARKMNRQRASLLQNTAELNLQSARLRHLCALIVRDRRPYCPANGVMLLLPLAATDTEEDANQTGELVALDLKSARQVLQVHCPLFALVCDMDTLPGFQDFIGRFQANERGRRVGQRFPLNPALQPDQLEGEMSGVVTRISQQLIPSWVYKLLKVEASARDTLPAVLRGNVPLFRLMSTMRDRQARLGKILTRGVLFDNGAPLLLGGCYIAGTGGDASRQAFVAGVFQRLRDEQDHVAWTRGAIEEEAKLRRLTALGYILAAVLAAGLVGLAYLIVKSLMP